MVNIENIDATTIDLFIKREKIEKVDLIKIDIEGAELLCFKGAETLLSSATPPVIIMECCENFCDRFEYRVYDLLEYLAKFGYKFYQYEPSQWLAVPNNEAFLLSK